MLRKILIASAAMCGTALAAPGAYTTIGSVQSLQTFPLVVMQTQLNIEALSYHSAYVDDGGGKFQFQTFISGAPTPDGNIIIAPSDHPGTCSSGCMVRKWDVGAGFINASGNGGPFTPSMFGATCNTIPGQSATDSTSAFQAALNFIGSAGGEIYLPCTYNVATTLTWNASGGVNGARGLNLHGSTQGDTNGSGINFTGNNQAILQVGGYGVHIGNMAIGYANPQFASEFSASISGTTLTITANPALGAIQGGMNLHSYKHNVGGSTTYEGVLINSCSGGPPVTSCVLASAPGNNAGETMTAGFVASTAIQPYWLHDSSIENITSRNGYDFFFVPQVATPPGNFNAAFGVTFKNILIQDFARSAFWMQPFNGGEDNNTWINIYYKGAQGGGNILEPQSMFVLDVGEAEASIINTHMEFLNPSSFLQCSQCQNISVLQTHLEGNHFINDQAIGFQGFTGPVWLSNANAFNINGMSFYNNTLIASMANAWPLWFILGNVNGTIDGVYETGTTVNSNTVNRFLSFSGSCNVASGSHVDIRHQNFGTAALGTSNTDSLPAFQWAVVTDGGGGNFQRMTYASASSACWSASSMAQLQTGTQVIITDSTVTTGNVTVGGGAHVVVAIWNGTNWVVSFDIS